MAENYRPSYRPYSRLAKVEEQKNKRTALLFVILTGGFLLFLAIFGIKLISNLASFLADVRSQDQVSQSQDTTPPAPPIIFAIPEYTNQQTIEVKGSSEEDATITLISDNDKKELATNTSGEFSSSIKLEKGTNEIYAIAKDRAGNESASSKKYSVTFDDKPPEVEVIKPKDGEKFYGSQQKQLTVEGKTEPEAKVTINDRVVIVDGTGIFRFPSSLGDGENSFNIKSTDRAGNQTELTITVTYTP